MDFGKVWEVLTDVFNLVMRALALAQTDSAFVVDWNELLRDLNDLGLLPDEFRPGSPTQGVTVDLNSESSENPYIAPDGSLWPTEAQYQDYIATRETPVTSAPVIRKLSGKGRG